ncbi:hypothetical protein Nepgr_023649 [Nepenthes gracilis]|uniref:Uncharacterized protein n=1 Tax=Nepenthes gracilis TaxID=150966 RepID=A0AAD3T386_NEPGR|nr:hypothetical protein Nepgr_023649 [Nepenthes gracilis]
MQSESEENDRKWHVINEDTQSMDSFLKGFEILFLDENSEWPLQLQASQSESIDACGTATNIDVNSSSLKKGNEQKETWSIWSRTPGTETAYSSLSDRIILLE